MLIDRVAYRPLRQASKISMLITAIGVSFFLENLFNVLFGGSSRFFSAPDFFNQTRPSAASSLPTWRGLCR